MGTTEGGGCHNKKRGDMTWGNGVVDNAMRRGGQRTQVKAIRRWRWWVGVTRQGKTQQSNWGYDGGGWNSVHSNGWWGGKGEGQDEWVAKDARQSGGRGCNGRVGQTMWGYWVAEDTRKGGGQMTQGNWVVHDIKRGEGRTPRTQCSGRWHDKRGVWQCKACSLQ